MVIKIALATIKIRETNAKPPIREIVPFDIKLSKA
jgi:hypothetical protein